MGIPVIKVKKPLQNFLLLIERITKLHSSQKNKITIF